MRMTQQTPTELVIKDSGLWMTYLFVGIAAVLVVALKDGSAGRYLAAALFVLFGLIAARTTTFTFDALRRVVRWSGFKPFKSVSGEIPFDAIRDVTVEASSSGNSGSTYRLALLTTEGTVPMAYTYTGSRDGYASLRQQILTFVKPGLPTTPAAPVEGIPADLASSIESLLMQGRKIDAVALLRERTRIGLTEAVKRIDAVTAKMKAESASAGMISS